jgi:hypothetical protein
MKTQLIMTKCSKCRRIKVNSNWLPEPKFLARDAIYTHAYCPECLEKEMAMVEKYAPEEPSSATAPLLTTHFAHA